MLKKLISIFVIYLLCFMIGYAEETIVVEKNENTDIIIYNQITNFEGIFDEELPILNYGDYTYVPLRAFAERLGQQVDWYEKSNEIIIQNKPANKYEGILLGEWNEEECLDVSIIELIAYPDKYNGNKIRTKGIINFGFEDDYLFLTKEDQKYFNIKQAVSLDIPRNYFGMSNNMTEFYNKTAKMSGCYVEIQGTFMKNEIRSDCVGKLVDIKYIDFCVSTL